MHRDDFGTCLGIAVQQDIRIGHHEMRIKGSLRDSTQRGYHRRAKGQVRYKMPVHHIKMNPVGTGAVNGGHLLGKSTEVRCKD